VKTINVTFEDDEFEHLEKVKDGDSWRSFILKLSNYKLLLLFILLIPFTYANLVIEPQVNSFDVFVSQSKAFSLSLFNNNSFPIYNVSFSPISGLTFPVVDLAAGESKSVSLVAFFPNIGTFSGVSTVSFLYDVVLNSSPVNYSVSVSNSSFFPNNLSIFIGDGVFWNNSFNESIDVRDLGSGFSGFVLPANSSLFSVPAVGNFSFYAFPFGFTGSLSVVGRPLYSRVHYSGFDVPVSFLINSRNVASDIQVTVFSYNLSSNNNQSQLGIFEVKNLLNVPLYNVSINSSSSWLSFNDNFFDILALGNRLVQFNLTPIVFSANETNRTHIVNFWVRANNAAQVNASIALFLAFADLDAVYFNGTRYVINRLSINDTIDFCTENPSDSECLIMVDVFKQKVEVIKEVPARQSIDEPTLINIERAASEVGSVANRIENSYNINKDYLLSIAARFDQFDRNLNATSHNYNVSIELANRRNNELNHRINLYLFIVFLVAVFVFVVWLINYNQWIEYLIRGGQL